MKSFKLIAVVAVAAAFASTAPVSASPEAAAKPSTCRTPPPEPPPLKPTTVTTIGEAYQCIFDNYFSGPVLDSRDLLQPAFAELTREMQRRGLDLANASAPVLTGKRDADWRAFSKVYQEIIAKLPQNAHQPIAEAAINAMVASLNDNHARWMRPREEAETLPVGFLPSHARGPGRTEPTTTGPAFVVDLLPGSAAANAGIKLGDEILAVNDVPLFIEGVAVPKVVDWLMEAKEGQQVKLTMRRPSTGETKTYNLTVIRPPRPPQRDVVESKLLPGDVAYVSMRGFAPGAADKVLKAIADLGKDRKLRGVVFDLRGNGGGSPDEVKKLVSAWVHGKTYSYWCDVKDKCTPNRTDDSVPLVNLPLITLTDRGCASACDAFSSAVKGLKFGTLVGQRTAGAVSGPGAGWVLDDGSMIGLPKIHEIGPDRAKVDTVGVPPDHFAPITAADLSAGRDPGVEKALALLR